MIEACNTIDGLDEFIALCDEHENEMNLEAARKLYRKSDFDCELCLHHIKQLGCPFKVCAYTPEKVCCECATLTAAIKYMIGEIHNERFNMVYKMTCKITENTKWDLWSSNVLNQRWHVEWQILLNTPKAHHHTVIAGKERNYSERIDAENYMHGRIRAFAKYFQEISPPVPADHKYAFMESGLMLPGYHVEGEEPRQERDSVIGKLNEAKLQHKSAPAAPSKKKKEPKI